MSESLPQLYERDIDVILQEELLFGSAVTALIARALNLDANLRITNCRLSVFEQASETDVFATFTTASEKGALLIENKINADFSPISQSATRSGRLCLPQVKDLIERIAF